ncbi:LysR substrate-binding domain-containing protein [Variovorax sp. WS11]|uniref:LysR substrate-binding domain-containing protein n=1 Tax=Variovorax sp. WS11 TaxID=1105204 RepID=UPI001EF273A6|nr:LysR substrate-binding domain-containing protein [Variovorax sp. WS11]
MAGESGTLRIGFSGSVTVRLPRLVQAFSRRHPAVRLELREGTNMELLALVEARTLDLGFVRVPTSRPPDLHFQPIEEDCFCLALPPDHPLADKPEVPLADLEAQPFIGYAPSPVGGLHAAVSQVLQRAGVAPRLTQEAVQVQTVLGLVASGLGLALVPSANTPYQRSSGAVFRPIADLPTDTHIGIALAYHARSENPALRRFLESTAALSEAMSDLLQAINAAAAVPPAGRTGRKSAGKKRPERPVSTSASDEYHGIVGPQTPLRAARSGRALSRGRQAEHATAGDHATTGHQGVATVVGFRAESALAGQVGRLLDKPGWHGVRSDIRNLHSASPTTAHPFPAQPRGTLVQGLFHAASHLLVQLNTGRHRTRVIALNALADACPQLGFGTTPRSPDEAPAFGSELFVGLAVRHDKRDRRSVAKIVTGIQYSILMSIRALSSEEDVTVNQLADHLHLSGSFVTIETGKLQARGLVSKNRHQLDGRKIVVNVTKEGKKLLATLTDTQQTINDLLFDKLSPADFRTLNAIADRLVSNADVATLELSHMVSKLSVQQATLARATDG